MSETKRTVARLFAAFADALDSMSDQEFRMLIGGQGKLRIVKDGADAKPAEDPPALDPAVLAIAEQLNAAESREAAEKIIASIDHRRRKHFLLMLSRACGVSVRTKDSIARIEENLVEEVVGTRLGSQSIRKVAF